MKFMVATPPGFVPYQIDAGEFPPGCERSCEGSLHVRPSSTITITAGELAVLKARTPGVAVRAKIKPAPTPHASPEATEIKPKITPPPKPRRNVEKSDER